MNTYRNVEMWREFKGEHGENAFAKLRVELRVTWAPEDFEGPMPLELSITGTIGYTLTPAQARRQARDYWRDFFEDNPDERRAMGERFGRRFRTPGSAAKFVLDTDGEYHGLDVAREDDGKVYIGHSWGCLHTELSEIFPECAPHIPYHLAEYKGTHVPAETIDWAVSLDREDERQAA